MKALLMLFLAAPLVAQEILPPEPPRFPSWWNARQGQAMVVRIEGGRCRSSVTVFRQNFPCRTRDTVIIGVPADARAGVVHTVKNSDGEVLALIEVVEVQWPSVRLPALRPTKNPPPGRLEEDALAKEHAFATHTRLELTDHLHVPLVSPTISYRVTAPFWLQRFYGKATDGVPHTGADLGPEKSGAWDSSPPRAWSITSGIVVLAQELWNEGNTVIVYHGDGVYTAYCHLSHISVKDGDKVCAGTPLGTIGNTGNSHGVHLHLTMHVGGVLVDPLASMEIFGRSLYLDQ